MNYTCYLIGRLSTLFLNKEEMEQISNLVIIDPQWLFSAMQVIMELPTNDTRITGEEQLMLEKSGKIAFKALEKLWSGSSSLQVKQSGLENAHKLCLILQAYCLIHPVKFEGKGEDFYYIIPSLLPAHLPDPKHTSVECSQLWMHFYFDFQQFLPQEIFHRLICCRVLNNG